jgi:Flp pilus assembly protein TadG
MNEEAPMSTQESGARASKRKGTKSGQGIVELALAVPVMLLLMLGTIDIGRVFFDYIELRNAAREGAGYGARLPDDTAGIRARVLNHGVPAGTTIVIACTGNCTVTQGVPNGVGTIEVTASHTFTPVTTAFLQNWFGLSPINVSAKASMRLLR